MTRATVIALLILTVSAFGDEDERDMWKKHTAFGDSALDIKQQSDWLEIGRYYAERREWRENPQHQLAKGYFQIYLDRRPSKIASKALDYAFTMWSNVEGGSYEIEAALSQVSYDEDVWDRIGRNIIDSYSRDERLEEGIALLEELSQRVTSQRARANILSELVFHWLRRGNDPKARSILVQLAEWNLGEIALSADRSKRYITEIDSLGIGTPAPDFAAQDIDNKPIRLSDYRGRIVVLYFWASWCSPCHIYYPSLRRIAQKYSPEKLGLIGVSLDGDNLQAIRATMNMEKFTWPQIVEGSASREDYISGRYQISGIPQVYVIDRQGNILSRGALPLELERSIRDLMK